MVAYIIICIKKYFMIFIISFYIILYLNEILSYQNSDEKSMMFLQHTLCCFLLSCKI
jgi:hypothetical protein